MEHRIGTCSACQAQFKVPATFKADKAKCKKCGGVVEIGPVQGGSGSGKAAGAAAAASAAKSAPKPPATRPAPKAAAKPPQKPAAKQRPAPAAKSGTRASRAGASARKGAPKRPAAGFKPGPVAAKAAAAKPVAGRSKPKTARAGADGGTVRDTAEAAAAKVRGGSKGGARKRPVGATSGGGRSGGSKGRGRSRRREKEKSKAPLILGTAVLLAGAGLGGWFFLGKDSGETQAAETTEDTVAAAEQAELDAAAAEGQAPTEDPAAGAEAGTTTEEGADPSEDAEAAPAEDEPKEEAPAADPNAIDLSELAAFGRLPETAEDDWNDYVEWAATFVDPAAGAAGNRARGKLIAAGQHAIPALINELVKVDVSTKEGYQNGDLIQTVLREICRGNNFNWRYTTEPKDQVFNKKVIGLWHRSWQQVVDDRAAWKGLGKLSDEEFEEYLAQFEGTDLETQEDIGSSDDLEDF